MQHNLKLDYKIKEFELKNKSNILSVDLECWHQIVFRNILKQYTKPSKRVIENTEYLLDLFKKKKVKATFFILGCIAEAFPDIIKKIADEGHEIATHGYNHIQIFKMTKKEFYNDLSKSIKILRKITGNNIYGFRAPDFSITKESIWALDVLMRLNLKYDSSIFPIYWPRYGIPNFPRIPAILKKENKAILEFPPSTVRYLKINWPVAGGGYIRLLPLRLIEKSIKKINKENMPFVLYCHPSEFDSKRLKCTNCQTLYQKSRAFKEEFTSNLFRKSMRKKLSFVLDEYKFGSFKQVLEL